MTEFLAIYLAACTGCATCGWVIGFFWGHSRAYRSGWCDFYRAAREKLEEQEAL